MRFVLQCVVDIYLASGVASEIEYARKTMEELRDNHDRIRMNFW